MQGRAKYGPSPACADLEIDEIDLPAAVER